MFTLKRGNVVKVTDDETKKEKLISQGYELQTDQDAEGEAQNSSMGKKPGKPKGETGGKKENDPKTATGSNDGKKEDDPKTGNGNPESQKEKEE